MVYQSQCVCCCFSCPCFVVQWVKACSALELCLGQRLRTYRSSFYQLKPLSRKRQERKSIKQSPLSHHMLTSSIHNRLMARFGNRSTLTGTHLGAAGGKRKCGQCILEPKWRRILRGWIHMCVCESMYECIRSFFQTSKTTTKQIVRAHNKWCTNHNVCAVVFPCPCFIVKGWKHVAHRSYV